VARPKTDPIILFNSHTVSGENGCTLWTGCLLPKGYGQFGGTTAHRWIYQYAHGVKLGRWEFVLHSCDNPTCVNIDHLRSGTPKENTADMYQRGRWGRPRAIGERVSTAKLTAPQVLEIRRRRAAGEEIKTLAREFGLHGHTVMNITLGRTWKHLPMVEHGDVA
jgi:hypothetical protein